MQNQFYPWLSPIFSTFLVVISLTSPLKVLATEDNSNHPVSQTVILAQASSESYVSDEGQFVVQFANSPETQTRSTNIAGQSTDWNLFTVQEDGNFYGVAYTDTTDEIIELGAKAVIDEIKDNLANEFNWSIINGYGKVTTVSGYPARELIGTRNNKLYVLRLVLANRRLYAVMSTSDELTKISQFMDSFAVQPWQVYQSDAGGFRIDFPLSPTDETESIELGGTEFNWQVLEARNLQSSEDDSYAVAYTDLSPDDLQQGADSLLERVGKNLIKKIQPQEIIENGNEIFLNGNPGRSFIVTTKEGQIAAIHFYLVNQRLYGVGARAEDISNLSKFLNSFQIQ